MASCIHPSCKCRVYQGPKSCKGTLLQLRLGCQTCSHQVSEHRQLTAVDKLIKKEVTAAARNQCTHQIPIADVPHSPVFKPFDPIPLPLDDAVPDKESQVPCTCTGFQVENIVKLWQKFRTCTMSDAMSALPKVTCSFCQHSLCFHQTTPSAEATNSSCQQDSPANLVLSGSAKVDFLPLNGKCLHIIPPKDSTGNIVFVALKKTDGDELDIVVYIRHCASEEMTKTAKNDDKDENCNVDPEKNTTSGDGYSIPMTVDLVEGQEKSSRACLNLSVDSAETVALISAGEDSPKELTNTGTTKKPRKRRRHPSTCATRKSARLASKKQKVEEASCENAGSRVQSKLQLKEVLKSGEEEIALGTGDESTSSKKVMMGETMINFVDGLKKVDNLNYYRLPKDISSSGIHLMAAAPCSDPLNNRGGETALLLALAGSKQSKLFVCVIPKLCWTTVQQQIMDNVTSLSWQEQPDRCTHDALLCAGTSSGKVHVWSVHINTDSTSNRLHCSYIGDQKHTDAEITTCSWAPCGRLLVAGSLLGEVLIYSVEEDGSSLTLHHVQTLPGCCGAPVTCTAWSTDCRLLAVGGSDDAIQVLHCNKPLDSTALLKPLRKTILNYFKRQNSDGRQKYTHIYSLTGHQSFLAGLSFIEAGVTPTQLVSVGWDGQLLFWQDIFKAASMPSDRQGLPFMEGEPQAGFKLGPSATVEFLPLAVYTLLDCGVLVALRDKAGGVTVVSYTTPTLQ